LQRVAAGKPCQHAARAVSGVLPGDHACFTFGTDDEQAGLVGRYVRDAIERNERVLYAADRSDDRAVRAYVDAAGLDSERCLALGQLVIVPCAGIQLEAAGLDPDRQAAMLEAQREQARRDGFSGLAATGEMSWMIAGGASFDDIAAYEAASSRVFAKADVRGLCQYDRRLFPEEVVGGLGDVHGLEIATGNGQSTAVRGALTVSERDRLAALVLAGEIDLHVAPYLAARLEDHLTGYDDIVVEMAAVEFVDVEGARVLVQAARRLTGDRRLVLTHAPPTLERVLTTCGWRDHPSLVVLPRTPRGAERRVAAPMGRSRRRPDCDPRRTA
jgi:anti-anti-sigma factor